MHFVRTFSIMRAWGVGLKLIVTKKVRNYGKILSKTCLKVAGGGDAFPTPPPWIFPDDAANSSLLPL